MVNFSLVVVTFLAATASAAPIPIRKRINQIIDQSTAQWEQACLAAGGGERCNPQSIKSFDTLLANAGPCDQQDQADNMIDLAKSLNNNAEMIRLTQFFVQQPRNSPPSQSVPYCQQAPRNPELKGLFQCQFEGVDPKTFIGPTPAGIPVGSDGTRPFDHTSDLNTPGSCPAHPSGPIPDGKEILDLSKDPGASTSSGSGSSSNSSSNSGSSSDTSSNSGSSSDTSSNSGSSSDTSSKSGSSSDTSSKSGSSSDSGSGSTSGDFHLENGKAAQQLNAKFATLDANSPCTAGENACIGSKDAKFAQCVNGKFVSTPCGAPLQCYALPLVKSPGTSVTCTTTSDAEARIAATGTQGGITGSGS